jgi:hypothetical protein
MNPAHDIVLFARTADRAAFIANEMEANPAFKVTSASPLFLVARAVSGENRWRALRGHYAMCCAMNLEIIIWHSRFAKRRFDLLPS